MRQKLLLNDNWKFHDGDILTKEIIGHHATYMHSKTQNGMGAAAANFYDGDFVTVRLPHDYVLDSELSEKHNESQGAYKRNNAWYRKHFKLPCKVDESRVVILFEGAGKKTDVWCNGHFAGQNNSMYNSFYVDITPYLIDDEVNTLAVKIDNDDIEGWWYEGAGIYRDVWMVVTDRVAVDVWGTYVNPIRMDADNWQVEIETTVFSNDGNHKKAEVVQKIYTANGECIGSTSSEIDVRYAENVTKQTLNITSPALWDLENRNMHTLKTEIVIDGKVVDVYETDFGFRTIKFGNKGFFLNGKHVKMRGACIHQDHGNLGVAVPKSIHKFRIDKMKSVGMNAYRCAHNNPSPALLDVCDQEGFLVIDENRWFNYSNMRQGELVSMLKRDRNHPSVVVWAVGNEEPVQSTLTGKRLVENLKAIVKNYDTTRPVTLALNGGFYDSFSAGASDAVGVNYNIHNYDKLAIAHPDKAILATESGASNNNRGIYFINDPTKFKSEYATAYDIQRASFGSAYIDAIRASELNDFISGTFVWAGMEYRGEAQWPKLFSGSGLFDNCGIEKDNSYMAKACWTDEPMVHILPHWNLAGKEGELIDVVVYANVDSVELVVNGTSLGKKDCEKYYSLQWQVEYQPGSIKAIGYKDGKVVAEKTHVTTGEPVSIELEYHKTTIDNSGEDCAVFTVHLEDKDGNIVPDANHSVKATLVDATQGEILALSNGDPMDHSDPRATEKKLFSGYLQVIARVAEGASAIQLKVECAELGLCSDITVPVTAVPTIARVENSNRNLSIDSFRAWFNCAGFADVDKEYNFDDMNTSEPITFSTYKPDSNQDYLLFTAKSVTPECEKNVGVVFAGLKGEYTIKIFHDPQTWPHPTPDEFLTVLKEGTHNADSDLCIPLEGFMANEKIKIIVIQKNTTGMLQDVHFQIL